MDRIKLRHLERLAWAMHHNDALVYGFSAKNEAATVRRLQELGLVNGMGFVTAKGVALVLAHATRDEDEHAA